jgi:hypothetical protein
MIEPPAASAMALVARWTLRLRNWLASRALPSPSFLSAQQSQWGDEQTISQWTVPVCVKRGLFRWNNKIAGARLYLDRRDFGPPGEPQGIWLYRRKYADGDESQEESQDFHDVASLCVSADGNEKAPMEVDLRGLQRPIGGERGDARDHRFEPITATRPYAPKV